MPPLLSGPTAKSELPTQQSTIAAVDHSHQMGPPIAPAIELDHVYDPAAFDVSGAAYRNVHPRLSGDNVN